MATSRQPSRAQDLGLSTKRLWRKTTSAFKAIEKRIKVLREAWDAAECISSYIVFDELEGKLQDALEELQEIRAWANLPVGSEED